MNGFARRLVSTQAKVNLDVHVLDALYTRERKEKSMDRIESLRWSYT